MMKGPTFLLFGAYGEFFWPKKKAYRETAGLRKGTLIIIRYIEVYEN
jgi:hypothetical protein